MPHLSPANYIARKTTFGWLGVADMMKPSEWCADRFLEKAKDARPATELILLPRQVGARFARTLLEAARTPLKDAAASSSAWRPAAGILLNSGVIAAARRLSLLSQAWTCLDLAILPSSIKERGGACPPLPHGVPGLLRRFIVAFRPAATGSDLEPGLL
ncbi:hypothetical protein ACQY0O_004162 [Thecaphora frezii]